MLNRVESFFSNSMLVCLLISSKYTSYKDSCVNLFADIKFLIFDWHDLHNGDRSGDRTGDRSGDRTGDRSGDRLLVYSLQAIIAATIASCKRSIRIFGFYAYAISQAIAEVAGYKFHCYDLLRTCCVAFCRACCPKNPQQIEASGIWAYTALKQLSYVAITVGQTLAYDLRLCAIEECHPCIGRIFILKLINFLVLLVFVVNTNKTKITCFS